MKTKIKKVLAICDSGIRRCRPFFRIPKMPKGSLTKVLAAVLGAVLLFTVVIGVGIYARHSRGKIVQFWSAGIPYPAGFVKWQVILYSDYIKDLSALEHFYSRQQESGGLPAPAEGVLEKAVVDRIIRNIALKRLAAANNVWVTADELNDEFRKTTSQVGTEKEAEMLLEDLYGWNKHTFVDRVLLYFVLEEKLLVVYGTLAELEEALSTEISRLGAVRFFGK